MHLIKSPKDLLSLSRRYMTEPCTMQEAMMADSKSQYLPHASSTSDSSLVVVLNAAVHCEASSYDRTLSKLVGSLCRGHKGKIGVDNLVNFAQAARKSASQTSSRDMLLDGHIRFQALCMQQLWQEVLMAPAGIDKFVAWCVYLLKERSSTTRQNAVSPCAAMFCGICRF